MKVPSTPSPSNQTRRKLLQSTAGGLMLSGLGLAPSLAAAQAAAPVEGRDFRVLGRPVAADTEKIEVIEFFWYGCPHCNSFEPEIAAWSKTLADDVLLRKLPVRFNNAMEPQQRLFFALEAMGLVETVHPRVFAAIHTQRTMLTTDQQIRTWIAAQRDIDSQRFVDTFNSFGVRSRATQAMRLAEAYGLEGVPVLYVDGRFMTAPSMVNSRQQSLEVVDYLVERTRQERAAARG